LPRRQVNASTFFVITLVTAPLAVMLEIGTIDLGHELSWGLLGGLSREHSAWLRYSVVAVAIASAICAVTYRRSGGAGRSET